jgi:hypothetical protein
VIHKHTMVLAPLGCIHVVLSRGQSIAEVGAMELGNVPGFL